MDDAASAAGSGDAGDEQSVRASDEQLVNLVRAAGPGSSSARMLEESLARYAIGTLLRMSRDRTLFRGLSSVMRISLPLPPSSYADEEEGLIFEAVAGALPRFMEESIHGQGWRPDGGASVTTYFVRTCMLRFVNVYRAFLREADRPEVLLGEIAADLDAWGEPAALGWTSGRTSNDPSIVVVDRMELAEVFDRLSARERELLLLVAEGWTTTEVAAEVGLSVGTVKNIVFNARQKVRMWRNDALGERSIREAEAPKEVALLWTRLAAWGVEGPVDAAMVKGAIEAQRKVYENPERSALYRPLEGDDRNQLDIILDGQRPGVAVKNQKKWTADSARVCREVIHRVREVVPSVHRPAGRRKGISDDLRELYRAVTLAAGS